MKDITTIGTKQGEGATPGPRSGAILARDLGKGTTR